MHVQGCWLHVSKVKKRNRKTAQSLGCATQHIQNLPFSKFCTSASNFQTPRPPTFLRICWTPLSTFASFQIQLDFFLHPTEKILTPTPQILDPPGSNLEIFFFFSTLIHHPYLQNFPTHRWFVFRAQAFEETPRKERCCGNETSKNDRGKTRGEGKRLNMKKMLHFPLRRPRKKTWHNFEFD